MKNIFKVTAIIGLVILFCGSHSVQARRWSPGDAAARAIRGDFNIADKEQLLRDLSPEWKKEHRKIVREVENGLRGRTTKAKEGGEKILDFEGPVEIKETGDTGGTEGTEDEDIVIEEKGNEFTQEQKKLQDIAYNFSHNINSIYTIKEIKKDKNYTKEYALKTKTNNLGKLNEKDFSEDFRSLVSAQNLFFDNLKNFEKSESNHFRDALNSYVFRLNALTNKASENLKGQLTLIAKELDMWLQYRFIDIVEEKGKGLFQDVLVNLKDFSEKFKLDDINKLIAQKEVEREKKGKENIVEVGKEEEINCDTYKDDIKKIKVQLIAQLIRTNKLQIISNKDIKDYSQDDFVYQLVLKISQFNDKNETSEDKNGYYVEIVKMLEKIAYRHYCYIKDLKNDNIIKNDKELMTKLIKKVFDYLENDHDRWTDLTYKDKAIAENQERLLNLFKA